jgi:serine phosphatase RsbU (regulator of sigma subunit)
MAKADKKKKEDVHRREAARRRKERLERQFVQNQLAMAADIQSLLLPRRIPRVEGYEMSAFYQPCDYVGGDYYDFIEIDEQHLGILVADVAGHGFPGALVMSQVRTMMRSEALHSLSPKEVLSRINRQLYGEIPKGMFVTMFYGVLSIRKSCVTAASAGHNPMVWWRAAKGSHEAVKPEGIALGIDAGKRFDEHTEELLIKLEPQDRFVLYTDGITEMMDRKMRQFGEARLCEILAACSKGPCEEFVAKLNAAVDEFRGKEPQRDDMTLLVVRRLAETPTRVDGFTYIDGDKFARCPNCATVNRRELVRCRSCGWQLETSSTRSPAAPRGAAGAGKGGGTTTRLTPVAGVGQCPSCKRIFREKDISRGCPYCMRRLCAKCGMRAAILGPLCDVCG